MRRPVLVTLVPLLVAAAALAAEGPQPMTAVGLLSVTVQREVRLSPDGRQLLFLRSAADWEQDKLISHVWRVSADGSGLAQMTNGKDGESAPRWSPDGGRVCFVAKRDAEKAQLWLLSATGGEAVQLTRHATAVSDPEWAPDGSAIYFLADDPETTEEREAKKRSGDIWSYDRDFKHSHLWAVDVASGTERRVTSGDFSVRSFRLGRDGRTLVYQVAPTPLYDDEDEGEVWIRTLPDGEARKLTANLVAESGASLSPDGTAVLFVADASERFEEYHQGNLFVVPAAGGPHRVLAADFPGEFMTARWAADGRSIVALANLGTRTQLLAVDPAGGAVRPLTAGDHTIFSFDLAADGRLAWIAQTATSPGDVWIAPAAGGTPTRLTRYAEEVAAAWRLPRVEVITWPGRDGVTVEGILTYPLDYREGQRAPLVVQTHGGPAASSTLGFAGWADYTPVLAAKGYAVLDPNYRGSTGYGDAFLRDMVGHYFNQADDDVLAGVDALVARGLADPTKLVAMGWSAGGHMTNWLVTQTDRFAAASSGAGAANWMSMYGQSDVRSYRTPWFGGTPWQADAPIANYLANSPISHVSKAKTPTLILVGEKDPRVPMAQSIEMFRALRSVGCEAELLIFPGEPHGPRSLKRRLHKVNAELAWFERHLFGRSYEMEKPPESAAKDDKGGAPK